MKNKALLFTATAVCFGAASALGAVSSNVVGYTQVALAKGLNLAANTLDNTTGNHIADVLSYVPDGSTVYLFDGKKFSSSQFLANVPGDPTQGGIWTADAAIAPGTGFFIDSSTAYTVTFVGQVLQGTLSNPVPTGLSIKASQVPQAAAIDTLGLAPGDGDQVFYFAAGKYTSYQFLANDPTNPAAGGIWTTGDGNAPQLGIGQAVFISSSGKATWNRTFTVN
jgi:hypothetical protein